MTDSVISFKKAAVNMPQGLPRSILSYDYSYKLESEYGIDRPISAYDRWAMVMCGINTARVFFDGTAINCSLLQDITEDDKSIFNGMDAMCQTAMKQTYSTSKIAVMAWLKTQGIPLDETTFEREGLY